MLPKTRPRTFREVHDRVHGHGIAEGDEGNSDEMSGHDEVWPNLTGDTPPHSAIQLFVLKAWTVAFRSLRAIQFICRSSVLLSVCQCCSAHCTLPCSSPPPCVPFS
eukprot:scaffold57035_cov23-Tisochrysis_lutea.AAC.1